MPYLSERAVSSLPYSVMKMESWKWLSTIFLDSSRSENFLDSSLRMLASIVIGFWIAERLCLKEVTSCICRRHPEKVLPAFRATLSCPCPSRPSDQYFWIYQGPLCQHISGNSPEAQARWRRSGARLFCMCPLPFPCEWTHSRRCLSGQLPLSWLRLCSCAEVCLL